MEERALDERPWPWPETGRRLHRAIRSAGRPNPPEGSGNRMNEWIIVGVVAIAVIFGATKLPEIARNLGRSSGEFKKGLKEGDAEEAPKAAPAPQPAEPTDPPSTQA
jgi:sec-independent protein translocase protein TatA